MLRAEDFWKVNHVVVMLNELTNIEQLVILLVCWPLNLGNDIVSNILEMQLVELYSENVLCEVNRMLLAT